MRILRIIPLLALLAGCEDAAGPGARAVRLTTAVDAGVPAGAPNLQVTAENRGSRPVMMPRCGNQVVVAIDRMRDGRWEQYAGGFCVTAVVEAPLELAPGATTVSRQRIPDPGRYRVHLNAWHQDDPEAQRIAYSAPFDIP